MKYFALIFLFGLASASLLEIYPNSDEEDFLLKTEKHKHRADVKTDFGKKLHDLLDHIVSRIKQSFKEGKEISDDLFNRTKQVVQKLKDIGYHISDDVKKQLEELKSKYDEWAQELLDIIHGKKTSVQRAKEDLPEEARKYGQKLRHAFERVLKRINQTIEEGKHVSKELINKAKDLAKKLKEYGLEVSDEIKDMFKYWKERAKHWIDELLDIIHGDNSTSYYSEPKVKTELAEKLREEFERVVKRIKKIVEEGQHVSTELWEEAKDLATRLKEYGLNVKDEIVDMLHYIKERYYDWVQHLIDIFRGKKETL